MVHNRSFPALCFLVLFIVCIGVFSSAFAYDTIDFGSVDDSVLKMQRALQALGYLGASERDGVFGKKTLVAVCWFQSDMNMPVDGIPGDETLTKLYNLYKTAVSTAMDTNTSEFQRLSFGSKSVLVEYLQRELASLGYYSGYVDGFYGVQTKQAVICYQEEHNLFVDGVVNADTWISLFGVLNPPLPN